MEEQMFAGRVALVTGGSGGIGAELSRRLSDAGAALAVHYAAGEEAARRVVEEIESENGRAAVFGADLRDPAGSRPTKKSMRRYSTRPSR
jgi:NAD(P)-dependent dehydrogenase (short-subunit alcohol dehydrogenase family)